MGDNPLQRSWGVGSFGIFKFRFPTLVGNFTDLRPCASLSGPGPPCVFLDGVSLWQVASLDWGRKPDILGIASKRFRPGPSMGRNLSRGSWADGKFEFLNLRLPTCAGNFTDLKPSAPLSSACPSFVWMACLVRSRITSRSIGGRKPDALHHV